MQHLFYYKMRQNFITKCARFFITKCDSFITKCDNYYKMRRFYYKIRRLFQIVKLQACTIISKTKFFLRQDVFLVLQQIHILMV